MTLESSSSDALYITCTSSHVKVCGNGREERPSELKEKLIRAVYIALLVLLVVWNEGAGAFIHDLSSRVDRFLFEDFGRMTESGMEWLWRIHGGP